MGLYKDYQILFISKLILYLWSIKKYKEKKMNRSLEKFAGCSKMSIKVEECFRPMLNVLVSKEAFDELFKRVEHSMKRAHLTVWIEENSDTAASQGEDRAYVEKRYTNKGGFKVKRETPLQRRMKRAGASLTYNLLKREGEKEKLREVYERRMGKCLSYLDEANCIDEKEEEIWMKLFSGEEVDVNVKVHWLGSAGGLVFLLKQFRQEKLFSTPQMWSFWDWVAQRFVFANEEPAPDTLRKYNETENTALRKTLRKAVDALVYR